MCRNIKTLANFEPPATEDEVRASALPLSLRTNCSARPSHANQLVFDRAVDKVAEAARELLGSLVTSSPPRNRLIEAERAKARSLIRFATEKT